MQWCGDYEVFCGQRVTVELNITTDPIIFDNLIVMLLTGTMYDSIFYKQRH